MGFNNNTCRQKLVDALKSITPEMRDKIEELKKGESDLQRNDFIWHFLLQSLSGMGNNWGYYGLIKNKANYEKVTFEALSRLNSKDRLKRLKQVLSRAKVRMPNKKAEWLDRNYKLIIDRGGLLQVKNEALSQKGKSQKIRYMKGFVGIGEKYARNIWMDVYHPEFRDSIAIDYRISKITDSMGLQFETYEEHEQFYLDVAKQAGLNGWELDRLLFHFNDYFFNLNRNDEDKPIGSKLIIESQKLNRESNQEIQKENNDRSYSDVKHSKTNYNLSDGTINLLKKYKKTILNKKLFPCYSTNNANMLSYLIGKKYIFVPWYFWKNFDLNQLEEKPVYTLWVEQKQYEYNPGDRYKSYYKLLIEEFKRKHHTIIKLDYEKFVGRTVILKDIYRSETDRLTGKFELNKDLETLYIHNRLDLNYNFMLEEEIRNAISEYVGSILILRPHIRDVVDLITGKNIPREQFRTYFNTQFPRIVKVIDILPYIHHNIFCCETSSGKQFGIPVCLNSDFPFRMDFGRGFEDTFYVDEVLIDEDQLIESMKNVEYNPYFSRGIRDEVRWDFCCIFEAKHKILFQLMIENIIYINTNKERKDIFDEDLSKSASIYQFDMVIVNRSRQAINLEKILDSLVLIDGDDFEFRRIKRTPPECKFFSHEKSKNYDLMPKIETKASVFFGLPAADGCFYTFGALDSFETNYFLKIKHGLIKLLNAPYKNEVQKILKKYDNSDI